MKHDEIIQAKKEATNNQPIYGRKEFTFSAEELKRFASIIEKRTIERCAVAADKAYATDEVIAAIRKLGEQ